MAEGATTQIDPLILAQTRTTISFLILAPILLLLRGPRHMMLPRRDFLRCLLLGMIGLVGSNYFYYLAIQRTNVTTAIVLQYTAPVWVLLYMVVTRQERATWVRVASVLLAFLGSAAAVGVVGGSSAMRLDTIGVLAAQGAAVSFAFYNIFGPALVRRHDRLLVMLYAFLGSALFWIILNPPWKLWRAGYTAAQWEFLAIFAVLSMLLPFALYVVGLQYLDATRAIVTSCLEPVFAIIIAAILVGERVGGIQAIGILVVVGATVLIQMSEHEAVPPSS